MHGFVARTVCSNRRFQRFWCFLVRNLLQGFFDYSLPHFKAKVMKRLSAKFQQHFHSVRQTLAALMLHMSARPSPLWSNRKNNFNCEQNQRVKK